MVSAMMMVLVDSTVMVLTTINGDSSDDELDDGDFLSQLLRHTKAEVLVANARG